MIAWLLNQIGIESDITSRLEHARWLLTQPLVLWLGLAIMVPVGIMIFLRHSRNFPNLAPWCRGLLTTFRISVLVILVILLSGPFIRVREPVQQKPILALLLDESESMQLPAGPFGPEQIAPLARAAGLLNAAGDNPAGTGQENVKTNVDLKIQQQLNTISRSELVRRVLQTQAPILERLSQRFDIRPYRFAQSVVRSSLKTVKGEEAPRSAKLGQTTAIGSALQLAIAEASGQPLAGIVIISDGRVTAGPNPLHLLGETGEAAGVPIWSVAAGTLEEIDDVSLLGVTAPQNITLGDTVNIVATLRAQGFAGTQAQVELLDGKELLDSAKVVLGSSEEQKVTFRFQAKKPEMRLLTVRVVAQPGETVTRNNEQQVTLGIDQQEWQVLYLEGWPRWDFRFLDSEFGRDHGLKVRSIVESQLRAIRQKMADDKAEAQLRASDRKQASKGTNGPPTAPAKPSDNQQTNKIDETLPSLPVLAELPADKSAFAKYDVVLLGDVSPELLTVKHQAALVQAIKETGVGLILQAGTEHLPHFYREMPLGTVLPLEVTAAASGKGGMETAAFSPFTIEITDAGFLCPAFRPYDQLENNREIWSRMPPLYWAMNATAPAPATRVLATVKTIDKSQPLIAERYAGKGRVFLIGTDSTYCWKKNIGDQLFYPFWGRTLRQLAYSRQRQAKPSWLEVYPWQVELGEKVAVEIFAVDERKQPLMADQIQVSCGSSETKETETLNLKRQDEPGWFCGVWQPSRVGGFRLSYTDPAGKISGADVRVIVSGREFLLPSVDRQNFGRLAEASNGGALLQLHEFERLPTLVQGEPTDIVRVFEAQLWDNWLVLVILASLYCFDIILRRWRGLT